MRKLLEQDAVLVRNNNGLSPATLAAVIQADNVIQCFEKSPKVSKKDKVEALELRVAILGTVTVEMDVAFYYLHRAMEERYSDPNETVPKPASPLPVVRQVDFQNFPKRC